MTLSALPDLAQIALFWAIVLGIGVGLAWLLNWMTKPSKPDSAAMARSMAPTPIGEASTSTDAQPQSASTSAAPVPDAREHRAPVGTPR